MTFEEWKEEFQLLINNPPHEGDYLYGLNGKPVRLQIELEPGRPPLIFGRAYVPNTVGQEPLSWFAQDTESDSRYGWKIIIMPHSRDELIRKLGLKESVVAVKSVRILRQSQSGKSFLAEVAEW